MDRITGRGLLWNWGSWMYRFRHWIWGVWTLIFLVMAMLALKVSPLLKENGFTPTGSESIQGYHIFTKELGLSPTTMDIVYESRTGHSLLTKGARQRMESTLAALKRQSFVRNITFRMQGRNGDRNDVMAACVQLNINTDETLNRYADIRRLIIDNPDMNIYVTGATPVHYDMQTASKHDIIKSELIGLPIALIVLLFVFGTLLAGLLPLIVGLCSVVVTLGVVYIIALQTDFLSNFLPNIVTMLGLAVGIDYALFMVSRFREELHKQSSVEHAVAMTAQTAGQSILFSGIAVFIGLIAMSFIRLSLFHSLCIGGIIVVMMSVIVGNTLLLSLLGICGEKINRYPVMPVRWRRHENMKGSIIWSWIANGVMKRPLTIVITLSMLLIACAWPVGKMDIGIPDAQMLPPKYESRYGSDLMKQVYDERQLHPILLVLQLNKPYYTVDSILAVQRWIEQLEVVEGVARVDHHLSYFPKYFTSESAQAKVLADPSVRAKLEATFPVRERTVMLQIIPLTIVKGNPAFELINKLRTLPLGAGVQNKYVTGELATQRDIVQRIMGSLPYVISFILVVTYFVLFILFRSILLPLKAVMMNMLSLGASLGIVVLVFQYGYGASWLQVTATGIVVAVLPVIIFCVVFGISMDYEVFLLSRIAEEYKRTHDNEYSTIQGLIQTGSIITSAAFILIVVVGAFIFTDNELMKAIGLGLSVAVLLDVTLIRVFLVPAFMKLMGKWNWWVPKILMQKKSDMVVGEQDV